MYNTTMGKLQRQLYKGEYDMFKYAQIFEGDFIQITKRGEMIDVHNHVRVVTMGVASTSPILPLPDVMLLARPATRCAEHAGRSRATKGKSRKSTKTLELTRLIPLKFVRISIHDREKKQLHLKFPTGRSCYLQLCPPLGVQEDLFAYWENLVYLLQPPVDSNRSTYIAPAGDKACVPVFEEEDKRLGVADFPRKEDKDQISNRSLHVVSDVAGATSAAFAGGKEIQHDSHRFTAMPDVGTPNTKPIELDKASAAEVAAGTTAGTLSMVITKSAAPEQLSTPGAATQDPGRSEASIAIAGAANSPPKSIKMALAGAANQSSECPANTSLFAETSVIVATAKVEPTSKTAGEIANDRAAGPLISSLPRESCVSEEAGTQRAPPARAEAPMGRRDGREQREKERTLRSPHHHRATESHHKPGGDKILQTPSGRSFARQRNDKKEKGGSSPVTGHKGVSHAPITKDSRTSHKSGRSLSASSSGSTAKRRSRISSFLRTVKANLTTKTVASPHSKDVDNLTKTMENSMEAIIETGENGQGLGRIDSVASEIMDTRAL